MQILGNRTLYRDGEYVSFPNLARFADGTVACAFRHAKERQKEYGRVTHVDPTAKDVFIVSRDGGRTFSSDYGVIIDDEMMSDQDPCLTVLRSGRIIATYFRWALKPAGQGEAAWGENFRRLGRTLFGKYDCLSDGFCYSISDDNGKTWRQMEVLHPDGFIRGTAVRGNITELPDGALLLPFYGTKRLGELSRVGLMRSDDQGETFRTYSEAAWDPKNEKNYLEPNLYRTASGRLVGLYRTQTDWSKPGADFDDTYLNLHMSVSTDDGRTFGPVTEAKTLWGSSPFHALRLQSGNVLLSYGWRRPPFGIRARICNPELTDIDEAPEIILRDDAPGGDLGYPCSIQLDDGTIMVSYYIPDASGIRGIEATLLRE